MNSALRIIALTLLLVCAAGCASQDQENESSIPWNRPQSWEGGGMLGGFNQQPQGSTGH